MSVDVDIQDALCTWLKNAGIGAPIAWPLVAYAPTPGQAYLDVHDTLRTPALPIGVGFNSSVWSQDIFQVDAVMPDNGTGSRPGLALAALVVARFARGTQLVAGSFRLQIDGVPNIAPVVKDAPWLRFPVSIPYLIITR